MAGIIDKLVAVVGIEIDQPKIKEVDKALDKVKKQFLDIKTTVTLATIGIFEFERRLTRSIQNMGNTSKLLGIATDDFQALNYAASKSGMSVESITGAVSKLNDQLSDVSTHHRIPTELLQNLGQLSHYTGNKIDVFDVDGKLKQGYELFKQISTEIKKLEPRDQLSFSNRFFGSNIIPILDKVKEAKKELKERGLLLSDKDIKDVEKVNAQFRLLGQSFEFLAKKGAIALAPIFEEVLKSVNDLAPAIEQIIKDFRAWALDPETKRGLKDFIGFLSTIASLITTIAQFLRSLSNGLANVFTGAGVMGYEAQNKFEDLFARFSKKNFDNLVMKNPQQSVSNTTNNTQTANDNRVNNTTTNNNIMPSNMSSIYNVFAVT
jgi:hypothetical protein